MLRITTLTAVITALSACETTKGVGRDVQDAGYALEQSIE